MTMAGPASGEQRPRLRARLEQEVGGRGAAGAANFSVLIKAKKNVSLIKMNKKGIIDYLLKEDWQRQCCGSLVRVGEGYDWLSGTDCYSTRY